MCVCMSACACVCAGIQVQVYVWMICACVCYFGVYFLYSNFSEHGAHERLARNLWEAVKDENIENVRSLLEQKANPNHEVFWSEEWLEDDYPKYPPLHTACRNSSIEIVKELVKAGANVDASGGADGSTPLHLACWIGYKELVDYLISEAGCIVGELERYLV